MKADGRWRIFLFGSDTESPLDPASRLIKTCRWLEKTLIPRYTPSKADIDSIFDVRAVLQQTRQMLNVPDLPEVLLPHKGTFNIQDYEKVFTDEASYGFGHGEIYKARGISEQGCIIVARPDQYVSAVLPLGEEAFGPLEEFFGGFMVAVAERRNGHS
jgi:phenol 2-monooxygenase